MLLFYLLQLLDIIQQGLQGNEIVSLLMWVGDYTSKDFLGSPALNIETRELPALLQPTVIAELQNAWVYLCIVKEYSVSEKSYGQIIFPKLFFFADTVHLGRLKQIVPALESYQIKTRPGYLLLVTSF